MAFTVKIICHKQKYEEGEKEKRPRRIVKKIVADSKLRAR